MKRLHLLFLTGISLACASASHAQSGQVGVPGGELPPPGYGTLKQDDISIRLTVGDIEIRIIPLDQRVLRLLGNEGYTSLNKLVTDRRASIDSVAAQGGASEPGLLLVSFFGRRDGARFEPLNVFVVIRSQLFQPIGMVPFTASVTNRQLNTRDQATAVLVYDTRIPVYEEFAVAYGSTVLQDAWRNALSRVQREQTRVMSKVRQGQVDSAASP